MSSITEEERARAFREGRLAAKVDGHEARLDRINGSIEKAAAASELLVRKVDTMDDKLTGLVLVMPRLTTISDEVLRQEEVAKELKRRKLASRTRWERNRNVLAWLIGVAVALATLANALGLHVR